MDRGKLLGPAGLEESSQVCFPPVLKPIEELMKLAVLDEVLAHPYRVEFAKFVKVGLPFA